MQTSGKNKIEQNFRKINFLLFIFTAGILTAVIMWTTEGLLTETAAKYSLHYAASAVSNLNEHLEHEIVLLQSASYSKRIIDWFDDETNPEKKRFAYDDIANYADLLYGKNFYFAVAKSHGEYSFDAGASLEQLKPYSIVSPDVFKDSWFFECMKSSAPYILNTDIDKRDGRHRVWINKKVVNAKGEPVGVISSGSWFSEKMNEQFDHFSQLGARSFVLDADGVIQMDSSLTGNKRFLLDDLVNKKANTLNISEFIRNTDLLQAIRKFQLNNTVYKDINDSETIYAAQPMQLHGINYDIAVITPIRSTDWMVVTLFSRNSLGNLKLYNYLLLSSLLFSVLYFLASIIINRRLLFLPLHHLTASVEETKTNSERELYGIRREDEIGFLAQQIYTMREQLIQYNNDLLRAKDDAEAGNKTKNQFMLLMSHELRTPMNAILGTIYILKQKELNAEQTDLIRTAEKSAQQLLQIINDVIYFSDITTGNFILMKERFALHKVIRDAVENIRGEAEKKGLAVFTDIAADVPEWVISDSARFTKILSELLSNAVKFTVCGKVSLSVSVCDASPHGTDGAETPPATAETVTLLFAVEDTGAGMSPEELENIFAPFSQSDSSTTRKYGGIGIGLTICKHLARLLGGGIRCESTKGSGSTFYWTTAAVRTADTSIISADGRSAAALPDGVEEEKEEAVSLTVLVTEDNRINQMIITQILKAKGWTVDTADNGQIAVEMSRQKRYDIILMDIQMPVMDGTEAAERIKQNPQYADVPIIAVTANTQATDVRRYIAAGMADIVSKPVAPPKLIEKILELCGHSCRTDSSYRTGIFLIDNG
ncbi:MAG: response regulator [Planctomycetaceae bacterium]|jgi:signal transduction histidine kinase/ActR/RegA family two-component response regulator|nr:response regulator [Planctomycetaceae bacterium]